RVQVLTQIEQPDPGEHPATTETAAAGSRSLGGNRSHGRTVPGAQTRAVSRRNRHIAPSENTSVHAMTLATACHRCPDWVTGYRASSPTPYTGVNFAIVANVDPRLST